MPWITYRIEKHAITNPLARTFTYEVLATIEGASGIDQALFVHRVSDDAYSHVAMPLDLVSYPNTKAQAVYDERDFYRKTSMAVSFSSATQGREAEQHIKERLAFVTSTWDSADPASFDTFERIFYEGVAT